MAVIRRYLSLLVFGVFFLQVLLASSHAGGNGLPPRPPSLTPLASTDSEEAETIVDTLKEDQCVNTTVVTAEIYPDELSLAESSIVGNGDVPRWKQQLPFPLNNKTNTLQRIVVPIEDHRKSYYPPSRCEIEVYLLGTAHISRDSSRDVRLLLESVKPDAIFLEICHQRLNLLESSDDDEKPNEEPQDEKKDIESTGFWSKLRNKLSRGKVKKKNNNIDTQSLSSIASSLLSNMQGDYADVLDVELGGEFVAAYEYWKSVVPRGVSSFRRENRKNHVHMILGDRPVSLTLTRAWESLGIWGKIKLLGGLIISSLRKPKPEELREWMEKILNGDSDLMSESVADLAKHFPTLAEVILKERDAYMACKLQQTCWRILAKGDAFHNQFQRRYRLVAIVGAGHMEGICKWITEGGSLDTISSVAGKTKGSVSPSKNGVTDASRNIPESPSEILSKLVQIKASIAKEDHDYLVGELTELNPEFIDEVEARKKQAHEERQ